MAGFFMSVVTVLILCWTALSFVLNFALHKLKIISLATRNPNFLGLVYSLKFNSDDSLYRKENYHYGRIVISMKTILNKKLSLDPTSSYNCYPLSLFICPRIASLCLYYLATQQYLTLLAIPSFLQLCFVLFFSPNFQDNLSSFSSFFTGYHFSVCYSNFSTCTKLLTVHR